MILHIYHCSLAELRDYRAAPGRNRPDGTDRFPGRPGLADARLLPPIDGFDDDGLRALLEMFRDIDLEDVDNSPIVVNYRVLRRRLRLNRRQIRALLRKARDGGLLRRLTIDYDFRIWMRESNNKGYLVVMTCVEADDLRREPAECADAFCKAVDEVGRSLLNDDQWLERVIIVPNGHLAPRSGDGLPWMRVLRVLLCLQPALEERGYLVTLNSYGYTKLLHVAINAHKLGYVMRVV